MNDENGGETGDGKPFGGRLRRATSRTIPARTEVSADGRKVIERAEAPCILAFDHFGLEERVEAVGQVDIGVLACRS